MTGDNGRSSTSDLAPTSKGKRGTSSPRTLSGDDAGTMLSGESLSSSLSILQRNLKGLEIRSLERLLLTPALLLQMRFREGLSPPPHHQQKRQKSNCSHSSNHLNVGVLLPLLKTMASYTYSPFLLLSKAAILIFQRQPIHYTTLALQPSQGSFLTSTVLHTRASVCYPQLWLQRGQMVSPLLTVNSAPCFARPP